MRHNELVIRIALPRWSRGRWIAVATAVLAIGGAIAWATGLYTPQSYNMGDKLSAAKLSQELANIRSAIDELDARTGGAADCPAGYANQNAPGITVCKNAAGDEMVKVGKGLSAFWIDRYEASVWDKADGSGIQYGATDGNGQLVRDYPSTTFPKNGQRTGSFVDLYAVSKAGVQPSASLTWFQAQQACRASGKRLPTDEEWLAAASGTKDPTSDSNGANETCVTQAGGPRQTGRGGQCASAWGAQDMVGNVWEWTAQWYAGSGNGVGNTPDYVNSPVQNWPSGYGEDGTWNVQGYVDRAGGGVVGLASAAFRGGCWGDGAQAGVFALNLHDAPSRWGPCLGFRCLAR